MVAISVSNNYSKFGHHEHCVKIDDYRILGSSQIELKYKTEIFCYLLLYQILDTRCVQLLVSVTQGIVIFLFISNIKENLSLTKLLLIITRL